MPGPTTGRLCPICDSPIEKGAKKCSFCGTDLTIFGGESEGASEEEERLVKESFSEMETKGQKPTPALTYAPAAPKVEPAKPAVAPKEREAQFQCPSCDGIVKESDTVCPHCGAMFVEDEAVQFECPACGTLVEASATKCPGCGANFVEDESAKAEAPAAPAAVPPTHVPTPAKPAPATAETAPPVEARPAAAPSKDEELTRIISAAKRIRETREQEVTTKEAEKKKVQKPGGFRLFKLGRREDNAVRDVSQSAPKAPSAEVAAKPPVQGQKPAAPIEPTPAIAEKPATPGPAAPAPSASPPTKRQFPADPREQGKELARLVAEVRALLGIATERDIFIDESKDLLDRSITAGRERQFVQALEIISDAEDKLNVRLRDYINATHLSLQEETKVAQRLGGGNISRMEVLLKEVLRAVETLLLPLFLFPLVRPLTFDPHGLADLSSFRIL